MKKLLALALALTMAFSLAACHKDATGDSTDGNESGTTTSAGDSEVETTTELNKDYESYDNLVQTVTSGIQNGFSEEEQEALNLSANIVNADPSYETLGYLKQDLDGDGVEELIFGSNDTAGNASHIYDVYTLKDGKMTQILNGWDRNCYYLCDGNILANEASNGASNSCTTFYTLENGELKVKESVYYNGDKDADNPWFYSTTKAFDEDGKSISESEANAVTDAYDYQTLTFQNF